MILPESVAWSPGAFRNCIMRGWQPTRSSDNVMNLRRAVDRPTAATDPCEEDALIMLSACTNHSTKPERLLLLWLVWVWPLFMLFPSDRGSIGWAQETAAVAPPIELMPPASGTKSPAAEMPVTVQRHPQAIPRADFMSLERLAPEAQTLSQSLLLKALDGEAFYTLVGQLKPVSEGFWGSYFALEPLDLAEVERVRAALRPWNVAGLFHADVLVYESAQRGQRYASAYVVHVPSLQALVERQSELFGRWGITVASPPGEVLLTIERSRQPGDRWRGFGLLFGYPEYAVDFFVEAGLHQRSTGEFIERDFRQIPTFTSRSGRFVYAVPKLSRPGPEDVALERRATHLLGEYRRRRPTDKEAPPNPIELLRDWMDDGHGYCHPQHLLDKLPAKSDQELDAEIAAEKLLEQSPKGD
jgi:hypothetical protein